MKRVFQHPTAPVTGKKYWRSLGQLEDTPEFRGWLEREFPQGASEVKGGDISRRNFLKLMGASTALAGLGLSGCRRPEKHLVPFTRGLEWSIPGKPLFYTTARPTRFGYAPLVATTHDGRPTKIDGNPLHPASKGATDTHSQSSILDLYDPDRARTIRHKGNNTPADFEKALDELLEKAGDGGSVGFLLEADNSPTRERLRGEIAKKLPNATWAVYEPLAGDSGEALYGPGVAAVAALEKADVILALDSDFLGDEGDVSLTRAFSSRRKVTGPDSKMNRLYTVENRFTVTGGIADHRLRVPASQIGAFALALANEIGTTGGDAALTAAARAIPATGAKFNLEWIKYCAEDLLAAKGRSLVIAGARQPLAVQALAAAINAALGNLGQTVVGRAGSATAPATIADLARAITDKKVKTLFIIGGNPVYNAPSDLNWAELQKSVETVVRLGYYEDETSRLAHWNIPLAHYLEAWGDGRAADGSYVSVQPMILPLFGAWSALDLLAKIAGLPKPQGPELVQDTFRQIAGGAGDFVAKWAKFLHDGFLAESAAPAQPLAFNSAGTAQFVTEALSVSTPSDDTFEVVFTSCPKVADGRYSNNGWLQELPDPITKVTWDNCAQISPVSAKKLGLEDGDVIEIALQNRSMEIPVLRSPGHADGSLSIQLGYGRSVVGRVGKGTGFNAYPLRTTAQPYFAVGAKIRATGRNYKLALTQEHGALEGRGGDITREATLAEYHAKPDFAKTMGMDAHIPPNVSLYSNPPLSDIHQWGMVVDLNSCTGCSACMVACQAENNIPIVGKAQVIEGREMHWIRTDRYFASVDENDPDPELISQPMMCQHCENAPCETVCPVNATVHSEDGLNVMAYNRCIGTRYCANNCPFKVRRFNFFDYNQRTIQDGGLYKWNLTAPKGTEDTIKLSKNPNVTVRMRGVMEKCTFCVQRIQEAKIATKVAARDSADARIPADAFTVACAQACPADAIVFGDIANPASSVAKLKESERSYRLFEYLNIQTRVHYLARLRNPNPKMPGVEKIGAAMRSSHGHAPAGAAHPEAKH